MEFLPHIARESARFRAAVVDADPEAMVPTCPDWNTIDLLAHLAGVQHFWAAIARERRSSLDGLVRPGRPPTVDGIFDFYDQASADLIAALADVGDDEPMWTWQADAQHAGFIKRRQAHEALIHRLDAELLTDAQTSFDPSLATDGVDEALTVMYGELPDWATVTSRGDVGEVATHDTDTRWLIRPVRWNGASPSGDEYTDEAALELVTGAAPAWSLRGAASDLDAWFWKRPTLGEITRTGDTAPLEAVIASGLQ